MTHIPGHIPKESLIIQDTLDLNGNHIANPKPYKVHGYLYPTKNDDKPDTALKIIFQNNNQIQLPAPTDNPVWKDRKVGFHLKWIDLPGAGNKKLGLAYDLVDWDDHQNTEAYLQKIHRFKGKKVEDIDPVILEDLAERLENSLVNTTPTGQDSEAEKFLDVCKGGKWKAKNKNGENFNERIVITIMKQSAAYIRSPYFKREIEPPYDWIKSHIQPFDLADGFFGNH